MVTCNRCGVDFDPSDFIFDAPCPDCQDTEFFGTNFLRVDVARELEDDRINQLIERCYEMRMSDNEIGESIGMSGRAVHARRNKLGLPAHQFTGDEKWRDPEKVRAQLSERLTGNSYRKGKKAGYHGIKAQRAL